MTRPGAFRPRPRRVLVVEDDLDFAESLVELLEPQGFTLRTVATAAGALDVLASFTADIALIDVRLGSENGVELVPRLRGRSPGLICVLMTAYASIESAVDSLRSGAHDYWRKPLQPERVAQQIQTAIERRELALRRERQQRLMLMGDICSGIAHDLNNVLQTMLPDIETIDKAAGAIPPDQDAIRRADRSLEHSVRSAAGVCQRILAFARGAPARSAGDASRALRDSSDMLRRLLPRDVSLSVQVPEAPLRVALDAAQVEQVLLNLVLNSRHAVGGRGQIRIDLNAEPGGAVAHLCVSDDGCGIPAAILPRIFEPYFSTRAPGEGTGLGLSIVYGMVTAAGGDISVQSQPGEGTRFDLELPIVAEPEIAVERRGAQAAPRTARRVLLVDDEPRVLGLLEQIFKDAGHVTLCAQSAELALARLQASGEPIDALVSDVRLPGMSGIELARRIRQGIHDLPVILISGNTGRDADIERLGAGVMLVGKPFAVKTLVEMFETLCAGGG